MIASRMLEVLLAYENLTLILPNSACNLKVENGKVRLNEGCPYDY